MPSLGVFGGSFNPIHIGHLIVAEEARTRLGLDRVLFMVAGEPPHKVASGLAPARDRMDLVKLAIEGNDAFEASDLEIRRKGKSYTVETLAELRSSERKGTKLHLIVGQDSVQDMPGWRESERILKLARLVVAARPGFDPATLEVLKPLLPRSPAPVVLNTRVSISSTEIRSRIRRRQSVRYLVPAAVERAIRRRRLYGKGA